MPRLAQKKHRSLPWWSSLLVTAAIFTWMLNLLLIGINNARKGTELQELRIVEQSVNRAFVACYAMEGFYPPDIGYLIENYGLEVDQNKYYIYHEAFAPNVYPNIWVVRR